MCLRDASRVHIYVRACLGHIACEELERQIRLSGSKAVPSWCPVQTLRDHVSTRLYLPTCGIVPMKATGSNRPA